MRYSFMSIAAAALALSTVGGAQAAEVEVKTLNHGAATRSFSSRGWFVSSP